MQNGLREEQRKNRRIFVLFLVILVLASIAPAERACGQLTTSTLTATSGSCTIERWQTSESFERLTLDWTSDASGNCVASFFANGQISRVVVNPDDGGDAPTDQYDVTITDEDSLDVLASNGSNLSQSSSSHFVPLLSTYRPIRTVGSHTLNISNAGNAKAGILRIFLVREQ